jgi:hypothetical protein
MSLMPVERVNGAASGAAAWKYADRATTGGRRGGRGR